ncbi:MAG: universal stress protein [Geminicoccaceae bacterium]
MPASLRAIVHPSDFSSASDLAFAHALRIALGCRGRLHLLHVGNEDKDHAFDGFPRVRQKLIAWGELDEGAHARDVADKLGVTVDKVAIHDDSTVDGICGYLEGHPSDLLIMATHARKGFGRLLHREVASPVMRESGLPCLLLPPVARGFIDPDNGTPRLETVLIPVHHTPRPEQAFHWLASLRDALGKPDLSINLVHVGDEDHMPEVNIPAALDDVEIHRGLIRVGTAIDMLTRTALAVRADLIVMTTDGRDNAFDALFGSTTERLVREVHCPILAVPAR